LFSFEEIWASEPSFSFLKLRLLGSCFLSNSLTRLPYNPNPTSNSKMGCVSAKQAVSVTPALDHSGAFNTGRIRVGVDQHPSFKKNGDRRHHHEMVVSCGGSELGESGRAPSSNGESLSFRLRNLHKYIEGEQVAAGWPAGLSAVAGEAIHGWVPLNADGFEKLDKVVNYMLIENTVLLI
jgi:hypothetical protein